MNEALDAMRRQGASWSYPICAALIIAALIIAQGR